MYTHIHSYIYYIHIYGYMNRVSRQSPDDFLAFRAALKV